MTIQGFTRFRKHQVGKQTVLLTGVPATRVLPYKGAIAINPNRTNPDVDTGHLDPVMAPFSGAKDVTGSWDGKLAYNDLPYTLAAAGKGGVTPTSHVWTFLYGSSTADPFEYLTDEWGDDTSASDGLQAVGGVIDSYTIGFAQDLAACDLSAQLVYADASMATDRTPALEVDLAPTWVYGGDFEFFLDTVPGSIGATKWTDAIHTWQTAWNNNLDHKRFANGSNSRNQLAGYGRGMRSIQITIQVAKTAASMAEAATLDDDPVPARYLEGRFTSPAIVASSTHYAWSRRTPARLMSRADGEIGGNSTITLVYEAFYDPTLTYSCQDVVTNGLAAL